MGSGRLALLMRVQRLLVLLGSLSAACASRSRADPAAPPGASATASTDHHDDAFQERLDRAAAALSAGRVADAVLPLAEIIAHYEDQHVDPGWRNFCARSQPEVLLYLLMSGSEGQHARVLAPLWSEAFYLRGYIAIEQTDLPAAERWLKRAIDLSPRNSKYLAELGHIEQLRRDWRSAVATFKAAVEAAEHSPPALQIGERTRAMRGIGYVLIEIGELAAAKDIYEACLALDPEDASALRELEYIQQLIEKREG